MSVADSQSRTTRIAAVAFIVSLPVLVSSYVSNELVSPQGNPGVERPVVPADVFVYTLEASAFVLVAVGVTAIVGGTPALRTWLSGHLAVAFAWLALLAFLFITLGRQEQLELFDAGRADLLLDGRLPGWEGFYSVAFLCFGASMALLAYALLHVQLAPRLVALSGMALGALTALAGYLRLVLGRERFADEYTASFGLLMIWLVVLGVVLYRRGARLATAPSDEPSRETTPVP